MNSLKAKNGIPLHREIILETISEIEEYLLHTDKKSEKTTEQRENYTPSQTRLRSLERYTHFYE